MPISHWPPSERPRERLLRDGAAALSDSELLALLIGSGVAGADALDCARGLLLHFGSLAALLAAPAVDVTACNGLGLARFARIQAAVELARRLLAEGMVRRDALVSPQSVRDFLRLTLHARDREVFVALFLDARNRVITAEEMFLGTLTQTSVHPREVVRRALHHNAAALIFAHNHPSGLAEPSAADRLLTRVLTDALALVDVRVLDHFVVGADVALSFAERGLL